MTATYAAAGTVARHLTDEEARKVAELAITTGSPCSVLAYFVLRLLDSRPSSQDIDQLERFVENRNNQVERPKTCESLSRVIAAYRKNQ